MRTQILPSWPYLSVAAASKISPRPPHQKPQVGALKSTTVSSDFCQEPDGRHGLSSPVPSPVLLLLHTVTVVRFTFLRSPLCSPRHPRKITGPPSPPPDLGTGESPRLSVRVMSCSRVSSSDLHPSHHLYVTVMSRHRHLSSPPPVAVAPPLPSSFVQPEPPILIPVLPSCRCCYHFPSGTAESPSSSHARAVSPPLSPPLPRYLSSRATTTKRTLKLWEPVLSLAGNSLAVTAACLSATASSPIFPLSLALLHVGSSLSIPLSQCHLGPT